MEDRIKSCLKSVLDEDLDEFSLQIIGNSEKGDGYIGDVVFVSLIPAEKTKREYNLVLKCSKQSQMLRESTPVEAAFMNEIYIYETVLPAFTKFQEEKGIYPFDSVPKCYGKFVSDNSEVIVLENLKCRGYSLWDKRKPLTRNHIELVVEEYARFHSISVAMAQQQPQKFQEITTGLKNLFRLFMESTDLVKLFTNSIEDVYEVLKDDLEDGVGEVWKNLSKQIEFICGEMLDGQDGLKVVTHGDCWSNNMMYKYHSGDEFLPSKVAILDWQLSKFTSPIADLSYFLFAGISGKDLEDLDEILNLYYDKLEFFCNKLGSDLKRSYSKEEFFKDWKKYSRFGIMVASLIYKICATDKDEVIDISQIAEVGKDFSETFSYTVKNTTALKERAEVVVKYVVAKGLI